MKQRQHEQRQDIALRHRYVAFKNLNLCGVYDSIRAEACSLPADDSIHQQSPSKSIEELASKVATTVFPRISDCLRQGQLRDLLLAFAAEIKREAIES